MSPTSEPTPPSPAPTPPVVGRDLVEYIRTNRDTTSYILLGLSVVFLVLTVWLAVRGFQTPPKKTEEKKDEVGSPFDPLGQDKKSTVEVSDPKRGDYLIGGIGVLAAFLVTAASGAWVMVGLPHPSEEKQRSEARVLILVVGASIGVIIAMAGALYFLRWSDSLAAWLDKDEKKQAWRVLLPLVMIVAGAGLIFLSAQPARAEERNNGTLRRMVYGANFGLTVLLVLVVLVTANVVFAMKAPNQLDATQTGFYTLSPTTKGFIGQLDQPVTAYLVMPELSMREANDIRQVLLSYQEASGGKFSVRFVNPVTEKKAVRELKERYSRLDADGYGILLVSGSDDRPELQRHAYVPAQELLSQTSGPSGKPVQTFTGEGRLLRELRFLAENETRPVVYFTQSNGEMAVAGRSETGLSVSQLKSFLESHYSLDVKPLTFATTDPNPTIPADCGVLVVAEPQTPLADSVVTAVRRYMAGTGDGKKGRLVVLAGATPGLDGRGMTKTGLEPLLMEFNVDLTNKFVYASPLDVQLDPRIIPVTFSQDEAAKRNQISQALAGAPTTFQFPYPREVRPAQGAPAYQATTILHVRAGVETWVEDDVLDRIGPTFEAIRSSRAVAAQKQFSKSPPRSMMVAVSESGGSGRVVVIGNGLAFADDVGRRLRTGSAANDLVGASIDWLRDRPAIPGGIEAKQYIEYTPPSPDAVDTTRLVYLPLGLGLITIAGLGAGVWVIRRK